MKLRNQVFIFLLVGGYTRILAVPGLEKSWQAIHPGTEITCTSCHNSNFLFPPSNNNATPEGKAKYQEILTHRKGGMTLTSKITPLKKIDFAVFGDSRSDLETNRKIVNQIIKDSPEAVFHTGDMVANGDMESQWNDVFPIYETFYAKKNLYHACGNHEESHCTKNVVRKALENEKAFYTVDFKGFTFIALDSNQITAEQLRWLSHLPNGKRYIPFFHHPPFPVLAGHNGNEGVIKNFVPQFKRLGVKLVFLGHNHGYDRNVIDGITYITTGGGGAPLYPCGAVRGPQQACVSDYHYLRCGAEKDRIECQTKLIDGSLVDSVTVAWDSVIKSSSK